MGGGRGGAVSSRSLDLLNFNDLKRSSDLRWLFDPVLSVILRWSCCLDRRLGMVGFCQSSIRNTTYSAKLIYCLKSCSWCTRESSQPWNSNLSKDKIRFWSLPSSSSQLDTQVPLSPHSPTTAAVAEKLKIFFSIFFPNGANVGAEVTFRISFRHLENFGWIKSCLVWWN